MAVEAFLPSYFSSSSSSSFHARPPPHTHTNTLRFPPLPLRCQVSGALKIDLSGVAKAVGKVGNLIMEVLNAVQAAIELGLKLLKDVDEALAELETVLTTGPFGQALVLTERIVNATANVLTVVQHARESVSQGQTAVVVSPQASAALFTASSLLSGLAEAKDPEFVLNPALSNASTALQSVLGELQSAGDLLGSTQGALLAPVSPHAPSWLAALSDAQALGVTVHTLLASLGKANGVITAGGLPAATLPTTPLGRATTATPAATLPNFQVARAALLTAASAAQEALAVYASGSVSDAAWVGQVASLVPQLTAHRATVLGELAHVGPVQELAALVGAVRASSAHSYTVLCSGEVVAVQSSVTQALGLLGDGASGSTALAQLGSTLGSMLGTLGTLRGVATSPTVTTSASGPTHSARWFTEAVQGLQEGAGVMSGFVDVADVMQGAHIQSLQWVTGPIEAAAAVSMSFVTAVQGMVQDSAFTTLLTMLQVSLWALSCWVRGPCAFQRPVHSRASVHLHSLLPHATPFCFSLCLVRAPSQDELNVVYAEVSEYTSDAATIRDVVVRLIKVRPWSPTHRSCLPLPPPSPYPPIPRRWSPAL
jgi:hypothetical protein